MKKVILAAICLVAASCSNDNVENNIKSEESANGTATVNVHVNDFSKFVEAFTATRASEDASSYDGVKAMTLAFYDSNGSEVYKTTQLRADNSTYTTFGNFSCDLPMGSYTMVVLGYGSTSEITLTSATSAAYSADKARETFVCTQAVNITTTDAVDLSATLSRICAKLLVRSNDNLTANAKKMNVTFSGGAKEFNPSNGLATSNTGFTNTTELTSTVGDYCLVISYLFLASDEQTMNVTINVYDAEDALLFSKTVSDVPLKRNRATTLRGNVFSSSSTGGFTLSTDWLTGNSVNF